MNVCLRTFLTRVAPFTRCRTVSDGSALEVTTLHPLWSIDRQDWVAAGELVAGEQLDGLDGSVTIESITPLGHAPEVHNIEVHSHHVYRVADVGVLVHNVGPCDFARLFPRPGSYRPQQLANDYKLDRIFKLDDDEIEFVASIFKLKPNLQVFRTNQRELLGDFLIIDRSNPNKWAAFLFDLKGGGGGAGNSLSNAESVLDVFEKIKHLEVASGNADTLLELLTRGRAAWPQ